MPDSFFICPKCALYLNGSREESLARHYLAHQHHMLDLLRASFEAQDWEVLKGISRHAARVVPDEYAQIFSVALTLFYGPVGLPEEHRAPDGQPSAAARTRPEVAAALRRASEEMESLLADRDRSLRELSGPMTA